MKIAPVSGDLLVKLTVIALAVAGLVYAGRKLAASIPSAGEMWDTATDKLSPLSQNNVAYSTVNAGLSAVLGRDETLGTYAYEVTHDGTFNPTSTNNAVYTSANAGLSAAVGRDVSVGTWIYDVFHPND